jgi:alpha-L-fucosidase
VLKLFAGARRSWRTGTKLGLLGGVAGAVAALTIATVGAPPAHAELQNPRQDWLRNSTGGLFLHWGERTSPGFTSCSAWENAINSGGWDANYWVNETKKLHLQYMVLAAFHSRLGYARAWPSKIPGTCSTKRDYLGELIAAAKKQDLHVILYMTDDPSHHNEGGHEWMDSGAYSKFKGHSVNLDARPGFGEFSMDNFLEVMKNYKDLAGFWIDNENQFWIQHNLYQTIRSQRPDMLLSNNNTDTPLFDTISNEQKTGMSPSYDMPMALFTAQPRLTEADYKLPTGGNWWFSGGNSAVDTKLTIGRYIMNAGSSVKSLEAETAMVNGKFPSNQANFNNFANGYLDKIWESIGGCEGGGFMSGGMPGGNWNDGAHGATTIRRDNPNIQYIHVIDKPSSNVLRLRDNGYHVTRVTDLRSGASRSFTQSNGTLSISNTSWDPFDTVFKVETSGRVGIYSAGSVGSTATSSSGGHAASNLTDGSYLNYWDSNNKTPVTVTLDLGSAKKVAYLGINQREWSVSYNKSSSEQSSRIKAYKLSISSNGTTWTPVSSGNLPSNRGALFLNINAASTRFVRLEVDSTWATSGKAHNHVGIDEMWLASDFA